MFVQSFICQISIKNNSMKFLTLRKCFVNFDSTIMSHFFVNITLCMKLAINITSRSSIIIIKCFNHAGEGVFIWRKNIPAK